MDIAKRFSFFKLIKQPHETYESMGSSTSYYLSVYDQNEDKPWFLSWNWVVFFTTFWGAEIFWLLYRRMYLFAILIGFLGHGLFEIFTLKLTLFANDAGGPLFAKCVQWIFKLIFIFGFTVSANALYFHFLRGKIRRGVEKKGTDPFTPVIILIFMTYSIIRAVQQNPQMIEVLKRTMQGYTS